MTDRTCTRCGTPIVPGAHFCSRCGHDVSGEQAVIATTKMAAQPAPPQPSEILEPLRHATIGDYDIAGELGRGGMATVFLAHDVALDRKVAIKVMSPSLMSGAGMAERFKREARTAAALSHPHIIPIYAVRETHHLLFFVMKFVDGRSLDGVIRERGQLPIAMVQTIAAQVGGALGYAHRRGIVHRDIKPANIMLDEEGWAVVTDFGIAKVADARGLTMTGVTIGTPSYMSPEQCASKEITGASDQYSLGIVLYEMLSGKVPFESDSLMGIMWKHFNEPPPPILEHRPDCPPAVAEAVMRMLAKDPKNRWPTLEDAIAALGQPPMAPDDPVRAQMRALARGGSGAFRLSQVHTPASPVPGASPPISPDAPTMPSSAVGVPSGLRAAPAATPVRSPAPIADAPTVATADASAGSAPRPVPTAPVAAAPAPPWEPAASEAPAPKRTLLYAGGLAAVAVVAAVGAWVAFGSKDTGPTTEPGPGDSVVAPAPPAPVAKVYLNPPSQSIAAGAPGELVATLLDGTSNILGDREVEWRSSDSTVVRVTAGPGVTSRIEGRKAGTARIMATSEGKSAEATVTVTAVRATVAAVTIEPVGTLAPGDSARLVAAAKDASGTTLGGRPITWASDNEPVARVTRAGFVLALGAGRATLTATSEGGIKTTAPVVVEVPPITTVALTGETTLEVDRQVRLQLLVRDARSRPVTEYEARWRSTDEAVAVVAAGMVTARKAGSARIIATVSGVADTLTVTVAAKPAPPPVTPVPARLAVASVVVSPSANVTLDVRGTASFTARAYAEGDQPLDSAIRWTSSDPAVATVERGTVTARAPGEAQITAESGGKRASVRVTVRKPPEAVVSQPVTPPPPIPVTPAMTISVVAGGAEHTCGLLSDGSAWCWGSNAGGQLGSGATGTSSATAPVSVPGTERLLGIVAGGGHSCGLTGDGTALCWGANASGQVGNDKTEPRVASPTPVASGTKFTQLAAGATHTCGIDAGGAAWCWGRGNDGQLGNGGTKDVLRPKLVTRNIKFRAIAAGEKHTCAVGGDGAAYCWGDGYANQLGTGVAEQQTEPVRADFKADTLVTIAAGHETNCALGRGGKTYCWGSGFSSTPKEIVTPQRFRSLTVGDQFACGLTTGGTAACWGKNDKGQLGDGSGKIQNAPVAVAGGLSFRSLAAGNAHACGVTQDGQVHCWGDNAKGQLGTGATQASKTPVATQPIRR